MFSLSPSFSTLYITQKSLSRVSFYFPSPQSHSSQFPARPRSVRCVGAPKYVMSCSLLAQIVSHSTCRNEASRFSAFAASYSNTENFTVQNFDRRAYFLHSVRDTYWHDLRELNLWLNLRHGLVGMQKLFLTSLQLLRTTHISRDCSQSFIKIKFSSLKRTANNEIIWSVLFSVNFTNFLSLLNDARTRIFLFFF